MDIVSNKRFKEDDLILFSEKIGYDLPNDYIEFLRYYNGGYIKNSTSKYFNNGDQKFTLTSFFGLDVEEDLIDQYEIYKNRIPETCIPIGRDAGGNIICLNLSENKYDYIYFWDHEEETNYEGREINVEDLYIIAESFNKFINSIESDNIKEPVKVEYKVNKVWIDPDFLKELDN